jgi:D-3-phosphoglycerate dehydrogenase
VFHTPGANNQAVADHTFALMLAVARRICFCHQSLLENRWEHTKIMGIEIWRKTLGLIGLGAIGRCVAQRAQGFRMRVLAYDPYWPEDFAREHGIERMDVDGVLKAADLISIHSPLTPETRGMIDRRAFGLMKPTAILINAARGGIIDEAALCEALSSRRIAGAGIDCFENEPPTDSPLLRLDNVVLTPHTAAFTHDAMKNMNVGIVDQIVAFARGERPAHLVNPEVWK